MWCFSAMAREIGANDLKGAVLSCFYECSECSSSGIFPINRLENLITRLLACVVGVDDG